MIRRQVPGVNQCPKGALMHSFLQERREGEGGGGRGWSRGGEEQETPFSARKRRRSVKIRNLKMAGSSHRYVRGSTVMFYEWLEHLRAGACRWAAGMDCGDCHMGNWVQWPTRRVRSKFKFVTLTKP